MKDKNTKTEKGKDKIKVVEGESKGKIDRLVQIAREIKVRHSIVDNDVSVCISKPAHVQVLFKELYSADLEDLLARYTNIVVSGCSYKSVRVRIY